MTHREPVSRTREKDREVPSHDGDAGPSYLRFGAMIASAVVVMYTLTYVNTYALDHVQWSESRVFMALTMGGVMALVMMGWMLNMYSNTKVNWGIVAASILVIVGAVSLDRTQATVQDNSFLSAMIPHHSVAILRSERADLADFRVCELAVAISEAQRREIAEMEWLIEDIDRNGVATTASEAQERPVPEFAGTSLRNCPPA